MRRIEVTLSEAEREQLKRIVRSGVASARKLCRARILLKADEGMAYGEMAKLLEVNAATVTRVCQRYIAGGLDALEHRKPSGTKPRRLDGRAEATLIQLACSDAPEGRSRWTLSLLAERLVELGVIESVSRETLRKTLKKTNSPRT